MTQIPIIMPQLGESIAEAQVIEILVKCSEWIQVDQALLSVETNKASMHVTSHCAGKVSQWIARVGENYPVGAILGYIEIEEKEAARLGLINPVSNNQDIGTIASGTLSHSPENSDEIPSVAPTVRRLPVPAHAAGASYMSPRMKARMNELGLHAADMAGIAGSGAAGRVTIDDLERYLSQLEKLQQSAASSMRIAVADAMRRSWTRPIATVGLPVSMDALLMHRKLCIPKPGPTVYALKALAIALSENSAPAGRLVGNHIVHPLAIDIGFAVEAEDGVLVPVIRQADKKPFKDLIIEYNQLVQSARKRELACGQSGNSIATVTNYGTFGLTWATPIPLPEQTLVLGLGAAEKTPHWDEAEGQFVPVTKANLTLSFDHRVLDGGAAGRLLTRIAQLMCHPEIL